jgi:hypothetical protein
VSLIDPSPHCRGAAYAAVDRHKLDDFKPYIFKTADYGKTWTLAVTAFPRAITCTRCAKIPNGGVALRRHGDRRLGFSIDDGAHWQKLRLNLPTVPVHDLVVKDDDLVVATHGRAFWILDDLTPLRKLAPPTRTPQRSSIRRVRRIACACRIRSTAACRRARIRRPARSSITTSRTRPRKK